MGTLSSFMGKFGGQGEDSAPLGPPLLNAGAPNALGKFLEQFSVLTESYWFYQNTEELRYNTVEHKYYRVDPDLGNLTELHGVTTVLRIIDKSNALVPWASKRCAEKILRTIPLAPDSLMLAPISLADFTKLVLEAKNAHKEILEDAADLGHLAHKCLEDSIQQAIGHTGGVVKELINLPTEEKAKACAQAGFAWMQAHSVRWIKTEQKVYSREFKYAGTMDGKAFVDSCDDPACCTEQFKDSLSIVDWKSSNSLHPEYILQAAGAYHYAEQEEHGEIFQNCFVLRLGKNEEEAGKFEPWRIPAKDFPRAFRGFLLCLQLVELINEVKAWISTQAKGVREAKKMQRTAQKALDKAAVKAKRAAEKAQLKLDRAIEKERIKDDAKKAREEAKHAKQGAKIAIKSSVGQGTTTGERTSGKLCEASVRQGLEGVLPTIKADYPEMTEQIRGILEEAMIERKPFITGEI